MSSVQAILERINQVLLYNPDLKEVRIDASDLQTLKDEKPEHFELQDEELLLVLKNKKIQIKSI